MGWYFPHKSTWSSSKISKVLSVLVGNGNIFFLAMGHMVQVKGCFCENFIGIKGTFFIFVKGTCPSLWCHKRYILVLTSWDSLEEWDKLEIEIKMFSLWVIFITDGTIWHEEEETVDKGHLWPTTVLCKLAYYLSFSKKC